jgi:hypothetical protein
MHASKWTAYAHVDAGECTVPWCTVSMQGALPCRQKQWRSNYLRWKKHQGIKPVTKVFIIQGGYPYIRKALLQRNWCVVARGTDPLKFETPAN